ncbi:MAG: WD40/YVTN/BNR-like repeat-containing protein, partial [Flavobacteriaceae bacterium]
MIQRLFLFLLLLIPGFATSQNSTTANAGLLNSLNEKIELEKLSLVKNIRFKNIGPTIMSGRVVDLDVNPNDPTEFYVAYASGGLWYTNNNGTSFEPVMDSSTQNLGDIAVHWESGTIWVGTGENNASRSSYAGIGLLKSTDRGNSWEHMGLADSHHIGRIIINPDNVQEVVVGVTGHLYTPNKERGIYKTTDGGKSWEQKLFVNDITGIIDLVMVPGNFQIQFAAAWEKERKAWDFRGNGKSSGIYKSTDGGDTWKKLTLEGSGFPSGEGVGRIGLDIFDEHTIYAVHDNQYRREKQVE